MRPMVPAPEDLFRDHAILRRILIVFDECARITRAGGQYDPRIVLHAANVFAHFGAAYHAKAEERYIFPLFRHTGVAPIVDNLKREHARAGEYVRHITALAESGKQGELAVILPEFSWFYRRHAAHEDISVFSQIRSLFTTQRTMHELDERLEWFENETLGPDGVERAVGALYAIEAPLGLDTVSLYGSPPPGAPAPSRK